MGGRKPSRMDGKESDNMFRIIPTIANKLYNEGHTIHFCLNNDKDQYATVKKWKNVGLADIVYNASMNFENKYFSTCLFYYVVDAEGIKKAKNLMGIG